MEQFINSPLEGPYKDAKFKITDKIKKMIELGYLFDCDFKLEQFPNTNHPFFILSRVKDDVLYPEFLVCIKDEGIDFRFSSIGGLREYLELFIELEIYEKTENTENI